MAVAGAGASRAINFCEATQSRLGSRRRDPSPGLRLADPSPDWGRIVLQHRVHTLQSLGSTPGSGNVVRASQKVNSSPFFASLAENAATSSDSQELEIVPGRFATVESLLDSVKWDEKGLAVAIAQNVDTGAILMQGFANRDALATTISSRKATFYSRSRKSLWTKGETSSNFINVHDIFLDCDSDSIIYLGKPDGPSCHTGSETCYYSSVYDLLEGSKPSKEWLAFTTLYSLESTITERKDEIKEAQNGKPSWTRRLLLDKELLCSKVREEAEELIQTLLENEDRYRTASEMADLLYHAMVLLRVKDVKMEEVLEVLRKRFSQSGVEEKNSRRSNPSSLS